MMLHLENSVPAYHVTSAADLLQETMAHYHVTQVDLASRLGVTQKYISDVLHRKEYINADVALKIEAVMGLSSKLLLNLDLSFRLHRAKSSYKHSSRPTKNFLKRYAWA